MEIDVEEINEWLDKLYNEELTSEQLMFKEEWKVFKKESFEKACTEINIIMKKYAKIEAEKFIELHNKYSKTET
jgi:hypothetical protein